MLQPTPPANALSPRVLVTYATRAGATADVAAAIGRVLAARGFAVTVTPITDMPKGAPLDGMQAVVIGSAIRMSQWLPEAVQFVRANTAALARLPTAIFTVHRLNTGADAASAAARQAYTAPVRRFLKPQAEIFFTGALDYSKLSFVDRLLAKAVEQSTKVGEGDERDWDKIGRWAASILN